MSALKEDKFDQKEDDVRTEVEAAKTSINTTNVALGIWLGVVTVATVVIFIVIYKRLGRKTGPDTVNITDFMDDAETGSGYEEEKKSPPVSSGARVIDFSALAASFDVPIHESNRPGNTA